MRENRIKQKILNGEAVFGCFVRYPDPTLVEFLAYCGWDFLVFDGEHGTIEPRDCENMTRAAELRDVTPIIRVPVNTPSSILRFLDTGAHGLHVPMVNSGTDAEAVIRAVKYQPRGRRGLAASRAADYGQRQSLKDYTRQANRETLVIVHIETREAVDRLPEILQVEGVDLVFIGPTDLSHSLGVPGDPRNPIVQDTITRIVDTVGEAGHRFGIMATDAITAREWRSRGASYITVNLEALTAPACRSYLASARQIASEQVS